MSTEASMLLKFGAAGEPVAGPAKNLFADCVANVKFNGEVRRTVCVARVNNVDGASNVTLPVTSVEPSVGSSATVKPIKFKMLL